MSGHNEFVRDIKADNPDIMQNALTKCGIAHTRNEDNFAIVGSSIQLSKEGDNYKVKGWSGSESIQTPGGARRLTGELQLSNFFQALYSMSEMEVKALNNHGMKLKSIEVGKESLTMRLEG